MNYSYNLSKAGTRERVTNFVKQRAETGQIEGFLPKNVQNAIRCFIMDPNSEMTKAAIERITP